MSALPLHNAAESRAPWGPLAARDAARGRTHALTGCEAVKGLDRLCAPCACWHMFGCRASRPQGAGSCVASGQQCVCVCVCVCRRRRYIALASKPAVAAVARRATRRKEGKESCGAKRHVATAHVQPRGGPSYWFISLKVPPPGGLPGRRATGTKLMAHTTADHIRASTRIMRRGRTNWRCSAP